MKARDIMTGSPYVIGEQGSLEEAARLMLAHKIGCLPVVDAEGKLAGIVTESDFAAKQKGIPFSLYRFPQVFGEWMPKSGVEKMYEAARNKPVCEVMSRHVATVNADDDVAEVLRTMQRTGFHRLPVVSAGKPVGVIARHDLLRLMVATVAPDANSAV
jgi:CBS domain-containing protein